MGSWFRESRNVELSTKEYLETYVEASWSNVSVVLSYADVYSVSLPVVAVQLLSPDAERMEVGGTDLLKTYYINIDIFATSDAMRLDLSDFILEKLKDSWVAYSYSHQSGNNTVLEKSADGRIKVIEFVENTRLDFGTDVDKYDRYRQFMQIRVKKS